MTFLVLRMIHTLSLEQWLAGSFRQNMAQNYEWSSFELLFILLGIIKTVKRSLLQASIIQIKQSLRSDRHDL